MTTESIQKIRRERWIHIGEALGLPLSAGQLDELRDLTDHDAARRFFPQLLDVEIDELLWAANIDDEVVATAAHADAA